LSLRPPPAVRCESTVNGQNNSIFVFRDRVTRMLC
jgi:hypothetical protein